MDPNTAAQYAPTALVGILTVASPIITAFFTRCSMSPKVKNVVAVVVAFVIAAVWVIFNGGITKWEDIFIAAPTVYGIEQFVYNHFFQSLVTTVEATRGVKDPVVVPTPEAQPVPPFVEETPAKG